MFVLHETAELRRVYVPTRQICAQCLFFTQPDPSSMRSGGLDLSMRSLEGACSVGTNPAANPAIDVVALFCDGGRVNRSVNALSLHSHRKRTFGELREKVRFPLACADSLHMRLRSDTAGVEVYGYIKGLLLIGFYVQFSSLQSLPYKHYT